MAGPLPRESDDVVVTDWDVELGIVIGTHAWYMPATKALARVAGYTVVNDVSERELQLERGSQWARAAIPPAPIGPCLVRTDKILNAKRLDMWLDVNGERMQTGNTKTMIFTAPSS